MSELRTWWGHLRGIAANALRCWWRLLPLLIAINLAAYVLQQVTLLAAAAISDKYGWVATLLVSAGLVVVLAGYVLSLRLIGDELGVRDLIPDAERSEVGETRSLASLLAITLLPFLGLYAAFGYIQQTTGTFLVYEIMVRGVLEETVLGAFSPHGLREWGVMLALLAAVYVVRRSLDLAHEHTHLRVFGLLAAFAEGFLLFVVFILASRGIPTLRTWFADREVALWLQSAVDGFLTSMRGISQHIPVILVEGWSFIWNTLWPATTTALFEPILWLAIAALVFGAKVMNLADLWRKGEPLGAAVLADRVEVRRWYQHRRPASTRARRVAIEIEEAFFGDLDDKYLPTFQSVRLVLGVGVSFLAAYLALFGIGKAIERGLYSLFLWIGGGRHETEWMSWVPVFDVAQVVFSQVLLLCIYGAAFHRAISLFHGRAARASADVMDDEEAAPTAQREGVLA